MLVRCIENEYSESGLFGGKIVFIKRLALIVAGGIGFTCAPCVASAQEFFPIIIPGNPDRATWGVDISADGQTVIGNYDQLSPDDFFQASGNFRWTRSGGFEDLRDFTSFPFYRMSVEAASDDGRALTGTYQTGSGASRQAYRYSDTEGYSQIDTDMVDPLFESFGISGDGRTIVGRNIVLSDTSFSQSPAIVRPDRSILDLGFFSPNDVIDYGYASGASRDGSVVVGTSSSTETVFNPFMWTEQDGMTRITSFDSGVASGVSRDGQWVFGRGADSAAGTSGVFRWSEDTGEQMLGFIPGLGQHDAYAMGISDDGSVIVGEARTEGFSGIPWEAYIWTEGSGMQNLRHVLEHAHGLDLTGWQLIEASAVSADGTTITGRAIDPEGTRRAFVAVVPTPGVPLLLAPLTIACVRRRR